MKLEGQAAIVTGGGQGIGRAVVERLAAEGARVAVADLKQEDADRIASSVVAGGGDAIALSGDVSQRSDCERMVSETVDKLGGIDVLVNSAGVTPRYAPAEWDFEKKWDWVVSINLKGTMMMSYFAVEHMKGQGTGSIINLASIIGLVGYAEGLSDGFNPYPHTKGGVVQLTRDMGVALAKDGVRVNSLCPGFTYTALTKTLTDDSDAHARLVSLHPMGRLGQVDEIANGAVFLASDESSFMTGADLLMDGGYSAW